METKTSNFFVGMAKEDITPELGCPLYGYPASIIRNAEKIYDPLTVGVAAIKQNEKSILLISAELCALNESDSKEISKTISKETGIDTKNIIISSIHTHSGPITRTSAGWGTSDSSYVFEHFLPKAVIASKNAISKMQPAVMGFGTAETLAGINRREIDENGNVILGYNPDGPYDPTVTLICFKALDGANIGSIAHFAAHPTAAARNCSFTRDWPGVMVDRVAKTTDAPCIFFNGAEGDIAPKVASRDPYRGEHCIFEPGNMAGESAEKAYQSIEKYEVPKVEIAYGNINLPFVAPPSFEAVKAEISEMEKEPDKIEGVRASHYAQLNKIKAVYESGDEFPKTLEIPQTIIALGDLVIVPAPFEVFCKISLAIREGSPYKHTVLFGLSNGSRGYMPTEDQIPFGGYEVDSFRAVGVVSLVDDTDKHFINQNVEIIKKLYNK